MLTPFLQGFGTGGGLIVAIGAQNAFVLSQAVRKSHHVPVAALCILCDAVLITAGVAGVGALVAKSPVLARWTALGGAAFLFWYGLNALRSALRGNALQTRRDQGAALGKTLLATLAVTLLNPHVYLDTVVLLGGVSGQFPGAGRYVFGAGAVAASFLWFTILCLFGRALAPVFTRPAAWRVLDGLVCAVMWTIAAALIAR